MVTELIKYIEDVKKQGFEEGHIKSHLSRHGWNEYLIDYAMGHVRRREDRRWLQGSVMSIFLIVLVTSGVVWWSGSWFESQSKDIACLIESPDHSTKPLLDPRECCARIVGTPCNRLAAGPQLRTPTGELLFNADVACPLSSGRLLTTGAVIHSCRRE